MADPDPLEGGRAACPCLHRVQVDYLRQSLGFSISGLGNDIAGRPDDPKVESWKEERDAYRRLDEGIEERRDNLKAPQISADF
jgi:hypothetical protein